MSGPIWILGTGVLGQVHLPALLAERLRKVRTVYTRITEDPSSWVPRELRHAELVSLAGEFKSHDRLDNSVRVANAVIAGANTPAEVVYCTPGSPVIYERPVSLIQEMALRSGMQCHVIPAVSCIDALLAFLGEDAAPALQVIEARWLVRSGIELDARINILLLQLDAFSTDAVPREADMTMASLAPLGEYLQRKLAPDSPAILVRAPWQSPEDPGYLRRTVISELGKLRAPSNLQGVSLFVPSPFNPDQERRAWWKMSSS